MNNTSDIRLGSINKKTGEYVHPNMANKHDQYKCPDCDNDLILKQGNIRAHHFAHCKDNTPCNYYNNPSETQIHKDAKMLMKMILEKKIPLSIVRKCLKCVKEDEYEIPEITESSSIIIEYRFEYNNSIKIADVGYTEYKKLFCAFEICCTHKTNNENRPEPWFEIEALSLISIVNKSDLSSLQLNCIRKEKCESCNDPKIYCGECINPNEGIIYVNQRGAGCGKTYESIQLMQTDERFKNKETFIYLTKMHSAKEVIFNELKEQEEKGLLDRLELMENDDGYSKQYKIIFHNKETNKDISIIIGTIDSFNYAIVDKNKIINDTNYFRGIVKSIKQGNITENGKIKYSKKTYELNSTSLIIIDEAQDLGQEYIEAFSKIITKTQIDVYVIGDKLQSIWGEHNILSFADKNDLPTPIHRSNGKNNVMRFHNIQFINFVNTIIDFNKYELPQIEGICNNKQCKYKHENDITPYNIFEVPTIYSSDYDFPKIDSLVERIINYMKYEIDTYNYLPHNFLFIFPILSRNVFATMLETRIQEFWITKFNEQEYQENVLLKNNFWKNKLNDNKFYKYIYLHKSDEGSSINLKESENATRILSIHSSKGNGCEVVFVFGISEKSLCLFSKKVSNLVYVSLLHVSITRQKKSLYMGIENNNDDICRRFNKLGIKEDINIEPILYIKKYNKYSNIIEHSKNNDILFNNINENLIEPNNYINLLPENDNNKKIIDWGHHGIRYSVMFYNIMSNIIENEYIEDNIIKSQFITILKKIATKQIIPYYYGNYNKELRKISENNKKEMTHLNTQIPILRFDTNDNTNYYKYSINLINIISNIQKKIIKELQIQKMPKLCPLESIILLFIQEQHMKGYYSNISIMDIYSIMYCYDQCSNNIDVEHSIKNECLCNTCFIEGNCCNDVSSYNEIRKSITNHYDNISQVKIMYDNYKKYIQIHFPDSKFTYNIYHDTWFGKKDDNFNINNEFNIIAFSDKYVLYFIIKPQFNKLNFNDIIFESIFNNFMLSNCDSETNNYKKYNNKKIITCILTFDSVQPIFYDLNIDKDDKHLKNAIQEYLFNTYTEYHKLVFKFYKFCSNNKPKNLNSVKYTYNQLKLKYDKTLPKYIVDYYDDINKELEKYKTDREKINNIMEKVNDESIFLSETAICLENNIKLFLENDDTIYDY